MRLSLHLRMQVVNEKIVEPTRFEEAVELITFIS